MLYRRYVTQFPVYAPKPFLGCGRSARTLQRSRSGMDDRILRCNAGSPLAVDGLSVHYYTDFRNSPEKVATFDARGVVRT